MVVDALTDGQTRDNCINRGVLGTKFPSRRATRGLDFFHYAGWVIEIGDQDLSALRGERFGIRFSQTLSCASYDGDFICQSIYRYLPEFYLTAIEIFVASLNGSNLLRNVDTIDASPSTEISPAAKASSNVVFPKIH